MSKDLPVLDAKAAFVDVGSEYMHVSIGGDVPMVFGTVTTQLHALRDWLLAQGVRSVAMEATGAACARFAGSLLKTSPTSVPANGRQREYGAAPES